MPETKPKKKRFFLLKRLLSLLANRAPIKQYYLELGAYFLKKGVNANVGQIVQHKHLHDKTYRVKIITGLFYDFNKNQITHTTQNKIVKNNNEQRGQK